MKNLKKTLVLVITIICNTLVYSNDKHNDDNNPIYWEVVTNEKQYNGISKTLNEAKKSIKSLVKKEIIIFSKFHELIDNSVKQTVYEWEIETENGIIEGSSLTFDHAKKCLEVLSKDSLVISKIIQEVDYVKK